MYFYSEVTANEVKLSNGDTIPCGLVVWSTGVAPRRFTKDLTLDKTKRGQVSDNSFTTDYDVSLILNNPSASR